MTALSPALDAAVTLAADEYRRELRMAVARELHDGPARELTGAIARLEGFRSASPDPRMQIAISTVEENTRAALVALRRIMNDLREQLPDEDVPETVAGFLERYETTFGVSFDLVVSPSWPRRLPTGSSLQVVRVIQEAVANSIRHGRARHVLVELQAAAGELRVGVHDDGVGIPAAAIRRPGFGITGMRERAALLGGSAKITRRRRGTSVVLVFPGCAGPGGV